MLAGGLFGEPYISVRNRHTPGKYQFQDELEAKPRWNKPGNPFLSFYSRLNSPRLLTGRRWIAAIEPGAYPSAGPASTTGSNKLCRADLLGRDERHVRIYSRALKLC